MTLLYGLVAVAILWLLSKKFTSTNAASVAKALKIVGGVLALGAAALLAFRGRFDMTFLLGGLGAWLLGWSNIGIPGFGSRARPKAGNVSRVRSAMIEMELDHDTGTMDGVVLAGALAGQRLNALDEGGLGRLYQECRSADQDGVRLLEAYLDRRFPRWREHAQRDADPGSAAQPQTGAMTEQEAYEVLGLQAGASLDEIRKAHRTLMKKLHPDQGGSTYLAARVNQAKEILLSRHR
jgi:DnaJ domain